MEKNIGENPLVLTKITKVPLISLDFGSLQTYGSKIDMLTKCFP